MGDKWGRSVEGTAWFPLGPGLLLWAGQAALLAAHWQLGLKGRGEGGAPGRGLPTTEFCFQGVHACVHTCVHACVHSCVHVCAHVQARRGRRGGLAGLLSVVQRFQAHARSALGGFQGQGVVGGGTLS